MQGIFAVFCLVMLLLAACGAQPAASHEVGSDAGVREAASIDAAMHDVDMEAGELEVTLADAEPFVYALPAHAPHPPEPPENPTTVAKVALGRALFFEPALSVNGTVSCATCHDPKRAYTVPEKTHEGALGGRTPRHTMSLDYVAYASYLTWSNLTLRTLEQQALVPLFGDAPVELGAGEVQGEAQHYSPARLQQWVQEDEAAQRLFARAFGSEALRAGVTWEQAVFALAAFQRSLPRFQSAYDRSLAGDDAALSPAQERGRALFFSDRLGCGTCHAGPLLSTAFEPPGADGYGPMFRNTGLYNLEPGEVAYFGGGRTRYPPPNIGIAEFTQRVVDDGRFRVPTLRNVAVTAPYMHDGSMETLEDVVDHYARGGRRIDHGPLAGDGRENPDKDAALVGFTLTQQERRELLAFLDALTDEVYR